MEITLEQALNKLVKNTKTILKITLTLLILTIIISLLIPKTYESKSLIQLPQIKGNVYTPTEAKSIINSPSIILPALKKLNINKDYEKFLQEDFKSLLINELFTRNSFEVIPYLEIRTQNKNAEKAQKLNLEISSNFIEKIEKNYNQRLATLENQQQTIQTEIDNLETEIDNLKQTISRLENKDLNPESLSKITLLKQILSEYSEQLLNQQQKLFDINEIINWKRKPEIINQPQIPKEPEFPNILINSLISVIIGLLISTIYIIYKK